VSANTYCDNVLLNAGTDMFNDFGYFHKIKEKIENIISLFVLFVYESNIRLKEAKNTSFPPRRCLVRREIIGSILTLSFNDL